MKGRERIKERDTYTEYVNSDGPEDAHESKLGLVSTDEGEEEGADTEEDAHDH